MEPVGFAHYDYELTQDEAERYSDAVAPPVAEPVAIVGKKSLRAELLVDRRRAPPETGCWSMPCWTGSTPGLTCGDRSGHRHGQRRHRPSGRYECPDVTVYATDVSQRR